MLQWPKGALGIMLFGAALLFGWAAFNVFALQGAAALPSGAVYAALALVTGAIGMRIMWRAIRDAGSGGTHL